MISHSQELQIAIDAAKAGGEIALKYFHIKIEGKKKKDASILTIADIEVEEVIKKFIAKNYSNASFIGEEEGGSDKMDSFWIIDPIDSTRNFSRGIPYWSINIALYKKPDIVLGVCYFPPSSETLYAEKNKGSFLNDQKVRVSTVNTIEDALIGHQSLRRFTKNQQLIELAKKSGSTRGYESNYSGLFVAQGKMEASLNGYGKMWDYAPFKVIIEEAGGKVTNLEGKPWQLHDAGFLASNRLLHDEIVKIINEK